MPSTGIKNQPHRFEIVAISSVDEDILASCNVVVVAGHREIDSSRTEQKTYNRTWDASADELRYSIVMYNSFCFFFLLRLGSSL